MTQNKPSSMTAFVWKILDTDAALKKDLARKLINSRALAKYIIREHKIDAATDAVVSAIRRYQGQPIRKIDANKAYSLLKQAKMRSVTKIASLTLRKNEPVHEKIAELLSRPDFITGDVLRVMEGAKIFKIIIEQKKQLV